MSISIIRVRPINNMSNDKTQKLNTKQIFDRNQVRNVPSGFDSTIVWLHNIRSMHNVGSAFRSADAFGVKGLILSGYTPAPPRPEISKTALGADESVDWKQFDRLEGALHWFHQNNYFLIGLEQTSDSKLIYDLEPSTEQNIALVFGNEVHGIDNEILPHLHQIVEIPQYGNKHSLNISVAVGIALFALHESYRKIGF